MTDVRDPADREKIKDCFLKKILFQESEYRQFRSVDSQYYELIASNTGRSPADGCCVGVSQVFVNAHPEYDPYNLITSYRTNVEAGFNILMSSLRANKGDLAAAATGYLGAGTYQDHCSGTVKLSTIA